MRRHSSEDGHGGGEGGGGEFGGGGEGKGCGGEAAADGSEGGSETRRGRGKALGLVAVDDAGPLLGTSTSVLVGCRWGKKRRMGDRRRLLYTVLD